MPAYRVIVKPSADKALQRLPREIQHHITVAMRGLSNDPRPPRVVKMHGAENIWRIRVGSYRIVYEIGDKQLIVLVLRIADRKDVYR